MITSMAEEITAATIDDIVIIVVVGVAIDPVSHKFTFWRLSFTKKNIKINSKTNKQLRVVLSERVKQHRYLIRLGQQIKMATKD